VKVYALYNVVAEVNKGKVRIAVEDPIELVEMSVFLREAKSYTLKRKVSELKELIAQSESGVVELGTKDSPIRLGGGLAQVEGGKLILIKRDEAAPRMPLTFDIPAGLFDELWEDPLQMMIAESIEVLRLKDGVLYYPTIGVHDETVVGELDNVLKALRSVGVKVEHIEGLKFALARVNASIEEFVFRGTKLHGFTVAFEYESPSLELIGIIEAKDSVNEFKYSDGEVLPGGRLLNREVHLVDTQTQRDTVWKLFERIRDSYFTEEVETSRGFTSKAARVSRLVGLLNDADVILLSKQWDLL